MKNNVFVISVFLLVLSLGLVFDASDSVNVNTGGVNANVNGNGVNVDIDNGNGDGLFVQTGNSGDASQLRVRIQDGEHMGENGQMIQVQTQANNKVMIKSGGVSADCDCEMQQEKVQNKTKLYVKLSNGQNSEVKIMPDVASEQALERLRLKVCSSENNCSIQLKEVGSGNNTQLTYELQTERHAKILGLFQAKMQVKAQVDAENGEVTMVGKPWWAFLAGEPAEE